MAWTEIERYVVGQAIDATTLNTLRDNIEHLRSPNLVGYFHDGSGSNWSLNVLTTRLPIDANKFSVTITTHGGPVTVIFSGTVRRQTAGYMEFGIQREGDWIDPVPRDAPLWAKEWRPITLIKPYAYLAPGTYTFTAYWYLMLGTTSNIAELEAATKPFMLAVESM